LQYLSIKEGCLFVCDVKISPKPQLLTSPPTPPTLGTVGRPLMSRGAPGDFVIFRPNMQVLLNKTFKEISTKSKLQFSGKLGYKVLVFLESP